MDDKVRKAFLKFKESGKVEDYLEYRKIINQTEKKR